MKKVDKHKLAKNVYVKTMKSSTFMIVERHGGWFSIHENGFSIGTTFTINDALGVVNIYSGVKPTLRQFKKVYCHEVNI